jgi:hypothetical protein
LVCLCFLICLGGVVSGGGGGLCGGWGGVMWAAGNEKCGGE